PICVHLKRSHETVATLTPIIRTDQILIVSNLGETLASPTESQAEMSRTGPIAQDWEPVVVRKKLPNAAAKKDEKAVNAARRAGVDIDIAKKHNAGTNKAAHSTTSLNTKRLDDDTENLAHERVPSDLKKSIMQARTDKKLTQAQLAQLINEKPQVIQEYESGKAIPNQQIIGKLERALGTKLRGKK
uniref:HTH cro/C1-type domain-containing protein n=8 Tax=Triticeae TaxID=147389 RepID=A0A453EFI2_AEGTS